MANSLIKLSLFSNQYEQGLRQAQKSWKQFMKGIGVSVGKFTAVGAAIGAVNGALKVAKEAFFANEKQLDEWNRTVESSKSVYNGFLSALNTGDISGFLSNIEQIISAAKSAYNALDELQTFKAYNQVQDARSRASYAKALDAYKLNPTAENKAALAAANQSVIDNIKQEQEFTKTAYTEALSKLANERGLKGQNRQDFIDMFQNKSYNEMLTIKNKYDEGKAGRQLYYGDRVLGGKIQNRDTGVWREMTETEKKELEFARALNQLNDEQIKATQALGKQAAMLEEAIWQQDRAYNRLAGNNGKVGAGGSSGKVSSGRSSGTKTEKTEEQLINENIQKLTQEYIKASNDRQAAIRNEIKGLQDQLAVIQQLKDEATGKAKPIHKIEMQAAQGIMPSFMPSEKPKLSFEVDTTGMNALQKLEAQLKSLIEQQKIFGGASSEVWQMFQHEVDRAQEKIDIFKGKSPMQQVDDDAKGASTSFSDAANSIAAVGSALQSIEDPSAKIAGIIGQAIANIALGFAQATAASSGGGIFGWIAAIVGGLGTMASTIEAIHSATGYAQGGIVNGNSYSGDNIPIMANAGEVVLTKAMANNLASSLQGTGLQNLRLSATVSGTQLRFVLNNESQMRGRGQYVTTNFNG